MYYVYPLGTRYLLPVPTWPLTWSPPQRIFFTQSLEFVLGQKALWGWRGFFLFLFLFFFFANRSVGCSLPLWRSEYPRPWWGTLDADVSLHLLPPPQRRLSLTFEYIHFVVLRVFPWSQLIPDYYALSLVPEALKTPRSLLHMNEDHSVKDDEA